MNLPSSRSAVAMRPAAPHFDLFGVAEISALASVHAPDTLAPVSGLTETPFDVPLAPLVPILLEHLEEPLEFSPVCNDLAVVQQVETIELADRPTFPERPSAKQARLLERDEEEEELFFERAEEVMAKAAQAAMHVASLEAETERLPRPVSREVLQRRATLRRVVSVVVGAAAVLSMAAGLSVAFRGAPSVSDTETAHAAALAARLPVVEAAVAAAAPATVAPATEEAAPTGAGLAGTDAAQPTVEPVTEAPKPTAAEVAALTRKALTNLEMGKYAIAIESAQASVAADPSDANPYLYWGTALMMTGKHAAAKVVFASCADAATRGPKHECKQFR